MNPFQPDRNWFETHWYSSKPASRQWRVTSVLATAAGLLLAVLLG
jgi:hypothetical protein